MRRKETGGASRQRDEASTSTLITSVGEAGVCEVFDFDDDDSDFFLPSVQAAERIRSNDETSPLVGPGATPQRDARRPKHPLPPTPLDRRPGYPFAARDHKASRSGSPAA